MKKNWKKLLLAMLLVAGTMTFVACGDDDDDKDDDQKQTSSLAFTYQEGMNTIAFNEQEMKSLITSRGFQFMGSQEYGDLVINTYVQQDGNKDFVAAQYATANGEVIGFASGIFTDDVTRAKTQFSNWCNQGNNYMKNNNFKLFGSDVDFFAYIEYVSSDEPEYENFNAFMSAVDNMSLTSIVGAYLNYEVEYDYSEATNTYRQFTTEFSIFNIENDKEDEYPEMFATKKYGVGFSISNTLETDEGWDEGWDDDWTKKKSQKLLTASR